MPLVIPCSRCNRPLNLPESLIGKSIKCPLCASVFVAQANGARTPPAHEHAAPAEQKTAPDSKSPAANPEARTPSAPAAPRTAFVPCSQCQRSLNVPENLLGKSIKCPLCGTIFVAQIKTAPVRPPAPRPVPEVRKKEPPAASPPPAPPKERVPPRAPGPRVVSLTCAQCKRLLNVPENLLGKKITCPMCKTAFDAPAKPAPPAATPPAPGAAATSKSAVPTTRPPVPPPKADAPAGASPPAVLLTCVQCRKPLRLRASVLGQVIRCPHCKATFEAKLQAPPTAPVPAEKSSPACKSIQTPAAAPAVSTPVAPAPGVPAPVAPAPGTPVPVAPAPSTPAPAPSEEGKNAEEVSPQTPDVPEESETLQQLRDLFGSSPPPELPAASDLAESKATEPPPVEAAAAEKPNVLACADAPADPDGESAELKPKPLVPENAVSEVSSSEEAAEGERDLLACAEEEIAAEGNNAFAFSSLPAPLDVAEAEEESLSAVAKDEEIETIAEEPAAREEEDALKEVESEEEEEPDESEQRSKAARKLPWLLICAAVGGLLMLALATYLLLQALGILNVEL